MLVVMDIQMVNSITISGGTPGYSEDWGTNNPNSLT